MKGNRVTRYTRWLTRPALFLVAAPLLLILASRISVPLRGGLTATATPGLLLVLSAALLYLSGVFLYLREHVSMTREAAAKDVLFSRLAHGLNNQLAAISAASETIEGNDGLRQALSGAARITSSSLYYARLRDRSFTPPALEPVSLADFVDFLELRLGGIYGDTDLTWSSQALPESILLCTNLGVALDSAERLVLRLFDVSAEKPEIAVTTIPT